MERPITGGDIALFFLLGLAAVAYIQPATDAGVAVFLITTTAISLLIGGLVTFFKKKTSQDSRFLIKK